MNQHQKLEQKLDRIFSEYIRRRDANEWGNIKCPICGFMDLPWKQMECTHFIKRDYRATRWNENNAVGACRLCNQKSEYDAAVFLKFESYMITRFGIEMIHLLFNLKKNGKKYTNFELKELIEYYKQKIKEL